MTELKDWLQNYTKAICPHCGDDRTGKGSLIVRGQCFCSEDHYEQWHDAIMAKYTEEVPATLNDWLNLLSALEDK
jgi:hypothetical protein